jgi:hypothetical protein
VHDDAAGKVEDAHRAEEAGLAPNHMGDRYVDQQTPQAAEPHDGREFHAFGKGADKESWRNDGEGHLEDKEQQFGDIPHKCFTGDAQEEGLGKVADKGIVGRKGQAITAESPDNGNQRRCTKTMDENGQHIAAANQAGVEHGQTRDHHKEY